MRVNDALTGGLLLALALAAGGHAQSFPAIPGQQYGAAVFPTAIALVLAGLSLVLILQGARAWDGAVAWSGWARSHHGPLRLALAVGGVLAYVLLSGRLGFLPTMVAVLLILLLALGTRWWVAFVVAIGVTLLIHLTFAGLLKVPLPWGVVPPFAWW